MDPLDKNRERRDLAKAQMLDGVQGLKSRVAPSALKAAALGLAKNRASTIVKVATKNPKLAIAGGAIAALYYLRKPLSKALRRLTKEK
jgi:hypothetical protein